MFFVKKGECVKGEIVKREENRCSNQTEFSKKKRDTEKRTNREQHSRTSTKKEKCCKTRDENKKGKIEKKGGQTCKNI